MTEFVPAERGTNIRFPSTAQFCIDSQDRENAYSTSPFNFSITRNTNLLTGFFTRLAVTEIMLDWAEPNIQTGANTLTVVFGVTPYTVTLTPGFYNVKQALDALVVLLNAAGTGQTFSIGNVNGQISLNCTANYVIALDNLPLALFSLSTLSTVNNSKRVIAPDLRLYRYIDITSSQLTYPQNVKDASTNRTIIDTLCRFYMAYDESPSFDGYGFPILLGYTPTTVRRSFPFPKQIKWENNIPIGNLSFEVYGNTSLNGIYGNQIITSTQNKSAWCLTLQVSEV